ncbi:saccharopine dehydrogenase family protein [Zhouia sp. PK063]|uniref:saccharopine dehydrogenase family protein n=1 Tax=Zhouia sp. PK063 TaxID=3373602 RepID=UPI0037BA7C61
MREILIIGGGKSVTYIIKYLSENAQKEQLSIMVADKDITYIQNATKTLPHIKYAQLDIFNQELLVKYINKASIIISMLPATLHIHVAKICLSLQKNLVTASYISDEMKILDHEVKKNELIFMNEVGLDPGIDHMSAMQVIDRIRNSGGKMLLFESFTGGLVAPQYDDNLWHYKFTWNPRNVVLAGQGGAAKFIQEGTYKYIPYHKLFRRTEFIEVNNYGKFEVYPNRDSLKYKSTYGLDDIKTLYRGTIRRVGFSKAWNMFVQLGMTDDSYSIENSFHMTYRQFVNLFLPYSHFDAVELKLRLYLKIDQDDIMWEKLEELDLFSDKKIALENATPAQILQKILQDKWTLQPEEKDMIVMYHKFGFELNGKKQQIDSSMVCIGENQVYTAMAKTVGLPVAIATLAILNKKYTTTGVQLPIKPLLYQPILKILEKHHITFTEKETTYSGYNPKQLLN